MYADVSLKGPREKRHDDRRAVADGIDLCAKRGAEDDAETNIRGRRRRNTVDKNIVRRVIWINYSKMRLASSLPDEIS